LIGRIFENLMCDAIKETDEKFSVAQSLMSKQGCLDENHELNVCLQMWDKDWRRCKVFKKNGFLIDKH
jgi:hypothetical protein